MTAGEVRQDFIHSHAIVLQALGRVGKSIYHANLGNPDLKSVLEKLRDIDWSRTNVSTWEGRAMIGGRMAKNSQNITLTCNQIKRSLGLSLTPEEQVIESAFTAARQ
ncbi:DNA sulfur modification protein DndB [Pseudomonas aeruginosa]|nr:DNA sulfur modification protein DndB [Pseudomonas aeruginosa]